MRLVSRLSAVLLPLLLLPLLGTSAQAAAKQHPWAAYYPATGVKCSYTVQDADGVAMDPMTIKVRKRTSKGIVLSSTDGRFPTVRLLEGGKAGTKLTEKVRIASVTNKVTFEATSPSPYSAAKRRKPGRASMTMTMTLPAAEAKGIVRSGRTLTVTATYRISGLGTRTIKLADAEGTTVRAIGQRVKMTSLKTVNIKPEHAGEFKRNMRPAFEVVNETTWYAKGRGLVLGKSGSKASEQIVIRQSGCR